MPEQVYTFSFPRKSIIAKSILGSQESFSEIPDHIEVGDTNSWGVVVRRRRKERNQISPPTAIASLLKNPSIIIFIVCWKIMNKTTANEIVIYGYIDNNIGRVDKHRRIRQAPDDDQFVPDISQTCHGSNISCKYRGVKSKLVRKNNINQAEWIIGETMMGVEKKRKHKKTKKWFQKKTSDFLFELFQISVQIIFPWNYSLGLISSNEYKAHWS